MPSNIVGTVTIAGPRLHEVSYETAAWHSTVALDPGTYEAVASNPHTYVELKIRVPGTYVYCFLPSLYCGVPTGTQPQGYDHRNVGTRTEVVIGVSYRGDAGWDEVELSTVGQAILAWQWIESPHDVDFNGTGLRVSTRRNLIYTDSVWGQDYRIDPNDGGLAEFTSSVHLLCDRVNALQAAGHDPDVWRVVYGDDRKPWFETPFEDHRPHKDRKFKHDYGKPRTDWRYYRPDYQPRRTP